MSLTGVRPRKISMNINFSKPTNRDGAKLIVIKETVPPGYSPIKLDSNIKVGGSKIVPEEKRQKKGGNGPGPALYSPRYNAVEGKRDKNV